MTPNPQTALRLSGVIEMMPLRGIAAAVESNPIISALPRAPKGRRNTGGGGAQRNPCTQSQPRIQSPEGATENVWHWFAGATHPGQLLVRQCDTPRQLLVRQCDTPRRFAAPLSERGWRGSALLIIIVMRQPIPSRRGVAEGRGVSHHRGLFVGIKGN